MKGSSPVREPEMKGENLEKCLQNACKIKIFLYNESDTEDGDSRCPHFF